MEILFINKKHDGYMSQGIMSLSAVLKQHGHKTSYVDTWSFEEVDNSIKKTKPDLLAFSSVTGDYSYYNDTNRKLKAKYGIMAVMGGPHATFHGKNFMESESNTFDGACVGEGEFALLDLCKKLEAGEEYDKIPNWIFPSSSNKMVVNPMRPLIEDLSTLPTPDFSMDTALSSSEKLVFWFHRGCPYKCTYCMNHAWNKMYKKVDEREGTFRKVVRAPNPAYCVEVIKKTLSLSDAGSVKSILIADDTFGGNIKWLAEFCEIYKKEINIPWDTHLYPMMITENRISLMAEAGCRTALIAIESGNEKVREKILKRPMSNKLIIDGAKIIHDHGMSMNIQNILLLPGETLATALDTFNLNVKCKPEIATASKFQPYPGVELTDYSITEGYLKPGDFEDDIPQDFHWTSVLDFSYLPKKDYNKILNLHNMFTFGTYFTRLRFLVYFLMQFPNGIMHHHIDNMARKVISHRNDIKASKFKIFLIFIYNFFKSSNIKETIKKSRIIMNKLDKKKKIKSSTRPVVSEF